MIKISVAIVAYKNYEDVMTAVQTLEQFTSSDLIKHIYIIDNSAPNNASEIKEADSFSEWLGAYPDAEYLKMESNLGFGAGHNVVIPKLNSQYHVVLNPDIIFTEDSLSKLVAYMDSNPDIGACIPRMVDETGTLQRNCRREITVFDVFVRQFCKKLLSKRYYYHTMQDEDCSSAFDVPFAQGSFLVMRTELFKNLKGFDERFFMYLEDADLCKRIWEKSRISFCPYTEVIHKWERGSHKNPVLKKYHYSSMLKYFLKWGFKFV